jgi:hypothetical protein
VNPFGCEHVVECSTELGVALMDKKPQRLFSFIEVEREVPCLLSHPGAVGVDRAAGDADAPRGRAR